ncbi:nicotinamidase-related amidase [Bradyrhizobium sp. JR6.1]
MGYQCEIIDPVRTVMIVVDMQNDFVAEGAKLRSAQAAAMVPRLAQTLKACRDKGIRVIYTAHAHRRDGSDMGLYDDLYAPIADRSSLVDGTAGVEIFNDLAPAPGEHVIKKHRYSAFFATDLDLILREWGITTVIISGTTTENCCHATARDAMFPQLQGRLPVGRDGHVRLSRRRPGRPVRRRGAPRHADDPRVLDRACDDGGRDAGAGEDGEPEGGVVSSPSPRSYGERVGVRGSIHERNSRRVPLTRRALRARRPLTASGARRTETRAAAVLYFTSEHPPSASGRNA